MTKFSRGFRIGVVALFGALVHLTTPSTAVAFDFCDGWTCESGPCTVERIQFVCGIWAHEHACSSTGGACWIDETDCPGQAKYFCTGNAS